MKSRKRERGLSLVELVIAMAILAVAIMALVSGIMSSSQIQQTTREKVIAYNAAREVIEQMRSYRIDDIYYRFNSNSGDDLAPPNPGNTFHVPRLGMPSSIPGLWTLPATWSVSGPGSALPWTDTSLGITNGFGDLLGKDGVGEIIFPEVGGHLSETYVDADMGMPKDLNRNGKATDVNVAHVPYDATQDYTILPVKVRVTWKGINGKNTKIEVNTFITEK
jgi:prepilin-type N-terminal cleavage/methylation domain-containing protein